MRTVGVGLGERGYEVVIGEGAADLLAGVVSAVVPGAARAAVVTQDGIGLAVDPGLPFDEVVVPEGEAAKSFAEVERLCRAFAGAGLSRSDVVIAVGGGVVTDLAGFAAASYLRGVAYVNVATSLLAQVDAAIGGKTGVNLPEGKNLVGAFWQPAAVLCDTAALATLPPREWVSGRGEIAKYALIEDGGRRREAASSFHRLPLDEQIARCVAIKAEVVAADEREGERRMILNYGHTLAHALEATAFGADDERTLRHGEAVAVGLVFAAHLARRLGRIDDPAVELHRKVVSSFDLSPLLPEGVDEAEIVSFMARDKKAHHDLTFVLDGQDGVEVVRGVGADDVVATLAEMEQRAGAGRR